MGRAEHRRTHACAHTPLSKEQEHTSVENDNVETRFGRIATY